MLRKLELDGGINLDVSDQSIPTGIVATYNCYQDRVGAWHTLSPVTEYGNLPPTGKVWVYDSPLHGVTVAVCGSRAFTQSVKNGPWFELGGVVLTAAMPTFTEDGEAIFFAADSPINKLLPTASSATPLGVFVAPDEDTALVLGVSLNVIFGTTGKRVVQMVSDQAKEIRYTVDTTEPTAASTLYTTPIIITADTTVKAIAIDNDDVVSAVTTETYLVTTIGLAPDYIARGGGLVGIVHGNRVDISDIYLDGWSENTVGFCLTEEYVRPPLNDPYWTSQDPRGYTYYSRIAAAGTRTLYLWLRDASGELNPELDDNYTPVTFDFLDAVTVPDAFQFTTRTDVARGIKIQSEALALTGLTFQTTISIVGGEYALSPNGGQTWTNWRTAAGTIERGEVVRVRVLASESNNTTTTATLTVGGVAGAFSVTTVVSEVPRNVTWLNYVRGTLMAVGEPAEGSSVPGDTLYSDDKANNYAAWEVYNNESRPDDVKALIVDNERIYNIGTQSIEVTYFDGVTPFAADRNSTQIIGTPAPGSVVFDNESIYFLSVVAQSRKLVVMTHGGAPQTISDAISVPLEQMRRVDDAVGFIVAFRGQNFYFIEFPSADITVDEQVYPAITFAYHIQKKQWFIAGQWNGTTGQFERWRGTSFAYVERHGLGLVGGRDGKIYQFQESTTVDYTKKPELTHKWRDDHSKTWSNPRTVVLHPIGGYRLPADQYQCGMYRHRQHEIVFTDDIDAGEMFRAVIKTGYVNHGTDVFKRTAYYRYNAARGVNDLTITSISEEVSGGSR
jgi:hypothetical protein